MSNPRDNIGSRKQTKCVHGAHPVREHDDVTEDVLDDDALNVGEGELAEADADRAIESGGQHAGMGRGEKPRKPKSAEK